MFKTTSALSVLLLVAACGRPAAPVERDGSLEFVLDDRAADGEDAVPRQLTITGLDRSFRAHVELSSTSPSGTSSSRNVRVELPAGLYAIDVAASASESEPVIPALGAPQLVVVAAGQNSQVNVLVTDAEPPAVAMLDEALAR